MLDEAYNADRASPVVLEDYMCCLALGARLAAAA